MPKSDAGSAANQNTAAWSAFVVFATTAYKHEIRCYNDTPLHSVPRRQIGSRDLEWLPLQQFNALL